MTILYNVKSGNKKYTTIPYVGNKSGFAHIFDDLIPNNIVNIIDVFGGSGSFSIYCSYRFGSENVTYNDKNPVICNFLRYLRDDVDGLCDEYNKHSVNHSREYFKIIKSKQIISGVSGAGRFLYLCKYAFSSKIRFGSNGIKPTMSARIGDTTIGLDVTRFHNISRIIKNITIKNDDFMMFKKQRNAFLYLDPPYLDNKNNHYGSVPDSNDFVNFIRKVMRKNKIMLSEATMPSKLRQENFTIFNVCLKRSPSYKHQNKTNEIIAINYTKTPQNRIV